jgi:hypothetical protein
MRSIPALVATMFLALPAQAALTDSEKAQVTSFVKAGDVASAAKVRALVARPDLSVDEASEPLSAGFVAVSFDERHEKFARELLVGPGSNAARSDLTPALVRALLARAGRALGSMPQTEVGRDALRADQLSKEVVRIHRFVSTTIANAGKPPADGHDASAGFRDDALLASAKAYLAHIAAAPLSLKFGSPVTGSGIVIRAQTILTASDLARGLVPRHELSAAFGLGAAQKRAFERHGLLIEDGGQSSSERLEKIVSLLDLVPGAADTLGLWLLSKSSTKGLTARGRIASARVSSSNRDAPPAKSLWPEDVEPATSDRDLSEAAYSLAWVAVRAAFQKSPALKKLAEKSAIRAGSAGADTYLAKDLPESVLSPQGVSWNGAPGASAELYLAHALRLVLLDPERALSIALARSVRGQYEPMTAFSLSLSALSSLQKTPERWETFSKISTTNGFVSAFGVSSSPESGKPRIDSYELKHDSDGVVTAVLVSGAAPKLGSIRFSRLIPVTGEAWMWGKTKLAKLSGDPLAVAADEQRFVMAAGPKSSGYDAIVTGAVGSDQSAHATIRATGRGGGLLLRGEAGKDSYSGVVLLLSGDPNPKATLVFVDGEAQATELAAPIALTANPAGHRVSLSVRGQVVSATVDDKKLEAKLTRPSTNGRMGLVTAHSGRIEVDGFGPGAAQPPKPKPKAKP